MSLLRIVPSLYSVPHEKADKGSCQKTDDHGIYRKHGVQRRGPGKILLCGDIFHDLHIETKHSHTDDTQPEKTAFFQFREIRG